MIRKALLLACAAGLFALAQTAHAAERFATVQIEGDSVRVPIPDGLCEPVGEYVQHAAMVARGDTANVTLLTLNDCADMAAKRQTLSRFAHLKAPKDLLALRVTREQVLAEMGAIPQSDYAKIVNEAAMEEKVSGDLTRAAGKATSVDMAVQPVAKDENAFYLAGVLTLSQEGRTATMAAAAGMTAVKGHLVSFNLYGPGSSPAAVADMLSRAKAASKALVAAND